MSILIEENDVGYTIAVREWASTQLDREIKHTYKSKRNAIRAVTDDGRNTTTLLCQLAWESARRAAMLEQIMLRLSKQIKDYVDSDVRPAFRDAGSSGSSGENSGGGDEGIVGSGEGARGSSAAAVG